MYWCFIIKRRMKSLKIIIICPTKIIFYFIIIHFGKFSFIRSKPPFNLSITLRMSWSTNKHFAFIAKVLNFQTIIYLCYVKRNLTKYMYIKFLRYSYAHTLISFCLIPAAHLNLLKPLYYHFSIIRMFLIRFKDNFNTFIIDLMMF